MQNKGSELPKEHILVCLSSSPSNERIVRMAGKMAQAFSGSLTALYVQTPGDADMNAEDTVRLQVNMRLAQQLGAEIVTTHGEDVATQIAEYVRLSDVTKIVIGRSGVQRRHFWSEPTLTERLIALAPEVDIHIIPDVEAYKSYRRKRLLPIRPAFPTAWELLLTIGILAAATVIGWVFLRLGFANANIIMVYLLGVLLTSAFTSGYTCGVLSAFLSVILFNYFLTEPRLSLAAYGSKYPITFAVMFAAALLTGTLAAKLKAHAQLSARDAYRTKLLFDMNRQLQKAETPDEVYLNDKEVAFGSTEYIVFSPVDTMPSSFYYFLIRSKKFRTFALQYMNGSSGRQRVSGDELAAFPLTKPSHEALSRFDMVAKPVLEQFKVASLEINRLNALQQLIIASISSR